MLVFDEGSILNPTFIGFSYWSVQFFSFLSSFHWSSSIGKPRMTHKYLGSVVFAFKTTLTNTLNHITCIILLDKVLKKTLIAINALLMANRVFSKTCLEVFIQVL